MKQLPTVKMIHPGGYTIVNSVIRTWVEGRWKNWLVRQTFVYLYSVLFLDLRQLLMILFIHEKINKYLFKLL